MDVVFKESIEVTLTRVEGEDVDVARAAWASTKGARAADEQDTERIAGLINMLMRDRHGSPFEQCGMQWLTSGPIFMWREHYRHRMASYNEQSGRYMQLDPVFYIPNEGRNLVQTGKAATYEFSPGTFEQYDFMRASMETTCENIYLIYERLLEQGIAKEVARMILPVSIFSTAYVRMNLRALMNFLSLRVKDELSTYPSNPMYEINQVANMYEEDFLHNFPIVYAAFIKNGRVAP